MNVRHLQRQQLQNLVRVDWANTTDLFTDEDCFIRLQRCLTRATTVVRKYSLHKSDLEKQARTQKEAEITQARADLQNDLEMILARQAQESAQAAWIIDGDSFSKRFFTLLRTRAA
jgi:hypothetical protein